MLSSRTTPYLIQRMNAERRENRSGVDANFSMNYMGSSEFEWGALPEALRRMRAANPEAWAPVKIESGKHVAFFVGPVEAIETARTIFADQLGARSVHLKEGTRIKSSYDPGEKYGKLDGWWAIDAAPAPWAIFKTEAHANLWIDGVKCPPVVKQAAS